MAKKEYYPSETFDYMCENDETKDPDCVYSGLISCYEIGRLDGRKQVAEEAGMFACAFAVGSAIGLFISSRIKKRKQKKLETELENLED